MKNALGIFAALLLTATSAAAQAPPSKKLERSIKLYDKTDYLSASIELQGVLEARVDTPENLMRAEFFLAKTMYQLKFYAASWAYIARIQQQGDQHVYFRAAAKWAVAIIRVAPSPSTFGMLQVYRDGKVFDDPSLDSVKDELAYYLGRDLATKDAPREAAEAMLGRVSGTSPFAAKAELEIARLKFRAKDLPGAFAAAVHAGKKPELTAEAARLIASWTHNLDAAASARDPLRELASTNNTYARYQHSRSVLDAKTERGFAKVSAEAFDAVMLATACRAQWPDDIKPLVRKTLDEVRPLVAKLIAVEDNAELFDHVMKLRKNASMPGADVINLALSDPTMLERFGWLEELSSELGLISKMDKAWQVTQVAAEVLQELSVVQAVEQADTGVHARQRLQLLDRELKQLASAVDDASSTFPLPAGPNVKVGEGLTIADDLCLTRGGTTPPTMAAGTGPRPSKASGCAGCSTNGPKSSNSESFFAAVALMLLVRARRRSASRN